MMTGTYVIKSGDEIIAESKNVITASGFSAINSFLAGGLRSWAGTLALGAIVNTVAASTDTALNYEILRYPVSFRAYNTNSGSSQIVLKATLEPFEQFKCYEIGVFAPKVNLNSFSDHKKISDFSETTAGSSNWIVGGGTASGQPAALLNNGSFPPRSNTYQTQLYTASGNSVILNNMSFDTSNYSSNDVVNLLYYNVSNAASGNFVVTFADSSSLLYGGQTQYWTASTTTASIAAGSYVSASMQMQNFTASAWVSPISSMSIQFVPSSGNANLLLDHIKFQHNLYPTLNNTIVSRTSASSSSASPIFSKYYGQPMDIEYYIDVTS
jgi:hypothetical protein